MNANANGLMLGSLVIVVMAVFVMSLLLVFGESLGVGTLIIFTSLPIGGFVTARVASSHKLLLALALVVPALAMQWIYSFMLSIDFPGALGFEPGSLLLDALLCLAGAAVALRLPQRVPPNNSLERTRDR